MSGVEQKPSTKRVIMYNGDMDTLRESDNYVSCAVRLARCINRGVMSEYTNICIFVCLCILIYGCANTSPPVCVLKPYWNEENLSRIKNKKDCCRYKCVPAPSYQKWNECVGDCSDTIIQSKTQPYEPKEWIRPRPYVYP